MSRFLFEDAVIISYPRSGRAWILTILENIQAQIGSKKPLIRHSHDGMAKIQNGRPNPVKDKKVYAKNDVILMVRHPADVVVSLWHMLNYRWKKHDLRMPLFVFFKHPLGLKSVIDFMNNWAAQQHKPKNFLSFSYEDLHDRDIGVLGEMFHWLGKVLSTSILQSALEQSQIQTVREKFPWSNSGDPGPNGWAARRGEANVWMEYFSPPEINWIQEELKQLDPYWERYRE